MLSTVWNILFFTITISFLIVIHEGGHFLVARWCGVKVYRFSLGFGNVLWSFRDKHGTEFAISAIPLGGYVQMKSENEYLRHKKESDNDQEEEKVIETDFADLVSGQPEHDSFDDKPLWQRAAIIAAGPICNLVLPILLYTASNMIGLEQTKPAVGYVVKDSIAAQAGIGSYDMITSINGDRIYHWNDVTENLVMNIGETITLELARDLGEGEHYTTTMDLRHVELTPRSSPLSLVGFYPCYGKVGERLDSIEEGSPAEKGGLRVGDKIIGIAGRPVDNWYEVSDAIDDAAQGHVGKPLEFVVEREGFAEPQVLQVIPDAYTDRKGNYFFKVGIGVPMEELKDLRGIVSYSPVDAFIKGIGDTAHMISVTYFSLVKLTVGDLPIENLAGPIGIAVGAGESAARGSSYFFWFLALMSVNLGLLNLLPFPALDGGQLAFLLYEGVTKRKPNKRIQNLLNMGSISLLLGFTAFVFFNDLLWL